MYSNTTTITYTETQTYRNAFAAHGILMFMAWSVFVPTGIWIAAFEKASLKHIWIHLHLGCMTLSNMCVLSAFITGLVEGLRAGGSFADPHKILGFIVIGGVVLVEIPLGIYITHTFRPSNTPSVFHILHWWVGRILFLLAISNFTLGIQIILILLGLYKANQDQWLIILWSVWIFGVVLFLIFICGGALRLRYRKRNKRQFERMLSLENQ